MRELDLVGCSASSGHRMLSLRTKRMAGLRAAVVGKMTFELLPAIMFWCVGLLTLLAQLQNLNH